MILGLVATICWYIWRARINNIFENKPVDFASIVWNGVADFYEFLEVNQQNYIGVSSLSSPITSSWIAPAVEGIN